MKMLKIQNLKRCHYSQVADWEAVGKKVNVNVNGEVSCSTFTSIGF